MPNRQGIWDKYVDGAKTVGHNTPYLGTQKMYVPSYMAGQAKSVDDLGKPEIAAMFDKDGKGEYWAGDAGWKSTRMWQVKFKSYGLTDLWEAEILPDATFKGQLKASINRERLKLPIPSSVRCGEAAGLYNAESRFDARVPIVAFEEAIEILKAYGGR